MMAPTDATTLDHQLAGLASLEIAIEFVIRAAVHSYPTLSKVQRLNEPPEIATARDFVDQCKLLLTALNAHWNALATGLPDECPVHCDYDDHDIPF